MLGINLIPVVGSEYVILSSPNFFSCDHTSSTSRSLRARAHANKDTGSLWISFHTEHDGTRQPEGADQLVVQQLPQGDPARTLDQAPDSPAPAEIEVLEVLGKCSLARGGERRCRARLPLACRERDLGRARVPAGAAGGRASSAALAPFRHS